MFLSSGLGRTTRYPAMMNGLLVWGLLTLALTANGSAQLTPETPRVRLAIENGIRFLDDQTDGRVGARALIGLTYAKYGADPTHPKIREAVSAIQAQIKDGPEKVRADIYSTGIAIMCLVAVDPSLYRYEIETLVQSLHLRQKDHGAWGYPVTNANHGDTCDTSMTQYAVLGLWEAEDQAGVETSAEIWDRVARWLILTQDPSGGFGYQGQPAERPGSQVKQGGVRHSMSAAAMATMYIVKDRVGIRKLKKKADDDTPAAFRLVEDDLERAGRIKTTVDLRHFARTMSMGNRWIEDKYDVDNLKTWIYYSLYAIERYESLKEAEEAGSETPLGKTGRSHYYNLGARYLLRNQQEDGSWESNGGPVPDTCFAVLFLLGSTRKTLATSSVATYAAGRLIGGKGLPDTSEVRVRRGQVVVKPLRAPASEVLAILSDPQHQQHAAAIEALADWAEHGTIDQLNPHAADLSRLAQHGPGEVRALAVQALARTKRLDQVPLLVHLLTQGDADCVQAASRALGQLSRRFGSELPSSATAEQREQAAQQWKAWYLTLRPDADVNVIDLDQ